MPSRNLFIIMVSTFIAVAMNATKKSPTATFQIFSHAFSYPSSYSKLVHNTPFTPKSHPSLIPLFSSSSSSFHSTTESNLYNAISRGVSRLSTLQSILSIYGAPGSRNCNLPNDLEPITIQIENFSDSLTNHNLHPHLLPIARSKSNPKHYVCALRRAFASEDSVSYVSSINAPWPIVESTSNGPGYNLLSLNSEHFMRRIAAEADFFASSSSSSDSFSSLDSSKILDLYNLNLGQGLLQGSASALDTPYQPGSVAKLGYGPSKFILLRVGPFPDLYYQMALSHQSKNDEASSLIAAETTNSKFPGFGSTFKSYAKLLDSFPNRNEEAKDAARMCLRLPLPSAGLEDEDYISIATLSDLVDKSNTNPTDAYAALKIFWEKIRQHEKEDESTRNSMTPEQIAIDEANFLLDSVVFDYENRDWNSIREKLGVIYSSGGLDDMAVFVDPKRLELE